MTEIHTLFGSRTRTKILQHLIEKRKTGESNTLGYRPLSRHLNEQLTGVRREIRILKNLNIIDFNIEGKQYIVNLTDNEALNKALTNLFYLLS